MTIRLFFFFLILTICPAQPGLSETRIPVEFRLKLEKPAEAVYLAGTFNNWQFRESPMNSAEGGRLWTLKKTLEPGAHQYKFVINGTEWVPDPQSSQNIDDGFGNINSVIWVEPEGFGLPAKVGDGKITRSATLHRPRDLRDRNPVGKDLRLTLRTRREDVQTVELIIRQNKRVSAVKLQPSASDSLFAYYQATVSNRPLEYLFKLTDGKQQFWVSPTGINENASPQTWFKHTETNTVLEVPAWVQDSVFYQIMPERFHNGDPQNDPPKDKPIDFTGRTDEFFGGDLNGVNQKIGYLCELGINALYLNPVFQSVTHHKYDTDDYTQVDPAFGGNAVFEALVKNAKAKRMRVVLDGVFNHVGIYFFAFQDVLKKQENSAYTRWFTIERYPVEVKNPPNYWGWWGIEYMPKLNHENKAVRDYILKVTSDWLQRVPFDGWRLDVANEVPDQFWREFRPAVRKANPEAVIIGEIWDDAGHWLQGDMFDSTMNYPWRGAVLDWLAHRRIKPSQFDQRIQAQLLRYPTQVNYALYNMLSSHDTPRIRHECGGDLQRVKLAYLIQMTSIGAPAIYYGDEIGMEGGGTPDNRRPMRWDWSEEEKAMFDYTQSLIKARRESLALRRGDWKTWLTDDEKNLMVFSRTYTEGKNRSDAVIVVNNGTETASVDIPLPRDFPRAWQIAAKTHPTGIAQRVERSKLIVTLPPMAGAILTPLKK